MVHLLTNGVLLHTCYCRVPRVPRYATTLTQRPRRGLWVPTALKLYPCEQYPPPLVLFFFTHNGPGINVSRLLSSQRWVSNLKRVQTLFALRPLGHDQVRILPHYLTLVQDGPDIFLFSRCAIFVVNGLHHSDHPRKNHSKIAIITKYVF